MEIERILQEFLALEQTTKSVTEMTSKFSEMALFFPQYATSDDMKMTRYADMLRTEIREFVNATQFTTLSAMIEAARRRELELETQARKRKAALVVSPVSALAKRPKPYDTRSSQRNSESRTREGVGQKGIVKCYKCGGSGHYGRDCRMGMRVCFQCGQVGHIKTECPSLRTESGGGGVSRAPNAAPLRITDGRARQPGTVRARVHQLTAEEAQTTPRVVTGTLLLCFLSVGNGLANLYFVLLNCFN